MFMGTLTAPTPKQQARELIERLPDTATWDDVAQAQTGVIPGRYGFRFSSKNRRIIL